jgi:putative SOS response-associated peptidase YedK
MIMAGLHDDWIDSNGRLQKTFTIMTQAACEGMQWLHSRQPTFLSERMIHMWLDPKVHTNFYICQ